MEIWSHLYLEEKSEIKNNTKQKIQSEFEVHERVRLKRKEMMLKKRFLTATAPLDYRTRRE